MADLTFIKSEEDGDGELIIVDFHYPASSVHHHCLAVGTGKSGEVILAFATSPTKEIRVKYVWSKSSPGIAAYTDITTWYPGLWTAQVTTSGLLAKQARSLRIQNILAGLVSLDYARTSSMAITAAPTHNKGRRSTIGTDPASKSPKKRKQQTHDETPEPETAFIEPVVTSAAELSVARRLAGIFETSEDVDGLLRVEMLPYADNGITRSIQMLLVGTGLRRDIDTTSTQEIFAVAHVSADGRPSTAYWWGYGEQASLTAYRHVRLWMPGFWRVQVTSDGMTPQAAREARIFKIFELEETMEHVMTTKFVPSSPQVDEEAVVNTSVATADVEAQESESEVDILHRRKRRVRRRARRPIRRGYREGSINELSTSGLDESDEVPDDSDDFDDSDDSILPEQTKPTRRKIMRRSVPSNLAANEGLPTVFDEDSEPAERVRESALPQTNVQPTTSAPVLLTTLSQKAPVSVPRTDLQASASASAASPAPSLQLLTPRASTASALPPPLSSTSMSREVAADTFYGGDSGRLNPQQVLEAISVLFTHTPPLSIVRLAILRCKTSGKDNLTIDDTQEFQTWFEESGAAMK